MFAVKSEIELVSYTAITVDTWELDLIVESLLALHIGSSHFEYCFIECFRVLKAESFSTQTVVFSRMVLHLLVLLLDAGFGHFGNVGQFICAAFPLNFLTNDVAASSSLHRCYNLTVSCLTKARLRWQFMFDLSIHC